MTTETLLRIRDVVCRDGFGVTLARGAKTGGWEVLSGSCPQNYGGEQCENEDAARALFRRQVAEHGGEAQDLMALGTR